MTFLCGCESGEVLDRDNLKTMDTVGYDEEGFIVCKVHGLRRSGWRSLPLVENVRGRTSDWSVAGLTELQIEALTIFGEIPKVKPIEVHDYEDKRVQATYGVEVVDAPTGLKYGGPETEISNGLIVNQLCWSGPVYAHAQHIWEHDGIKFRCPGASTDRP